MADLQRSKKLRKLNLFTFGPTDRVAGVIGQVSRDTCPFLWVCTMGITDLPEDDNLVQICLLANEINVNLSGINISYMATILDENWIEELQHLCIHLGQSMIETFELNVNTKLHRIMHHIKNQLQGFGRTIWSINYLNEFMHKLTKRVFSNTNKQQDKLHPQILANCVASVI